MFKSKGTYVVFGRHGEVCREVTIVNAKQAARSNAGMSVGKWRKETTNPGTPQEKTTWYSEGDHSIVLEKSSDE